MVLAPLPPVQAPLYPVKVPTPVTDPLIEIPQSKLPPVPIAAAAAKLPRERKRPAKVAAPAPVVPEPAPAAPVAPSPEVAIGALTAGGETNPQSKQDAADLIASVEKRLNALPAQMDDAHKAQINKVRNFWRDAQAALKSGDAEGAMTLATKAKLLLDDLEF